MKILTTGSAGFIGSHLSERLAALGHEVTGLDCFTGYYPVELKEQNAREVEAAGVKIHRLDLAVDDLDEIVSGQEVIYHLAAQPGISAHVSLEQYIRNNIIATQRLLEAVIRTGSSPFFINISTSSVYGIYATQPETAVPEPASFYGVTKLAAGQLVMKCHREGTLPACSLRLYSVYGPRERPDKLYTKLIRCILLDEEFPLHEGSEGHRRSYTFVDDAIDGLVAALEHRDKCSGEIINIGNAAETTTAEGISTVEKLLGKKVRTIKMPPRPGDQLHTRANITKARELLGYEPGIQPEEGLKGQVEWLRKRINREE